MIQQNLDSQSYFEKSQSQGCASQNADREFTTPNQNDQSYYEDDEYGNAENEEVEVSYYEEDGESGCDRDRRGHNHRMSLAEELMELQGLADNDMGETRLGGKGGEYEDSAMDFDDRENTNAADEFHQFGERTPPYKDPSKVFMESGIRRGMRQFNQQLIRSGGNTDLASYEEVVLVQTGDRSGGQTGSS